MFSVGQKVFCIDDRINGETTKYTPCKPRKGLIYTVRGIMIKPNIPGYGVFLEELPNPSILWEDGEDEEWPFKSERFRPLVEHKTDVRIEETA